MKSAEIVMTEEIEIMKDRGIEPNGRPRLLDVPRLDEDPHAYSGRVMIDGRLMQCTCGSRIFYGGGITNDGHLACQCYSCLTEYEFSP